MSRLKTLYLTIVLLFVILIASANLILEAQQARNENVSNLLMNRVYEDVQRQIDEAADLAAGSGEDGKAQAPYAAKVNAILQKYLEENERELAKEFGSSHMPKKISFLSAKAQNEGVALINKEGTATRLWTLCKDGVIIGFLSFEYNTQGAARYRLLLNLSLVLAFFIALGVVAYIDRKVLSPFGKFAEYPERLSKNQFSDKLPDTKNRLFGKFIWGINMLNDKMANDRKRISELSREHLTMVTTIAHGIKTPVSNIKLYADAIESGLYQPDGIVNESDAEVARKISKNADDVTDLVKKLIDKASSGVVDFEPEIKSFYLNDLKKFLEEEYGRRLELLKIPYEFEVSHNAILKSDKNGICRILSQLMENAIKYGNGEGISVHVSKEADSYHFSVKNKGKVLNDQELPYVFHSFWRGSNAEGIEGSGIGLFEAYEIARRLDGDIYVRTNAELGEMEFHAVLTV